MVAWLTCGSFSWTSGTTTGEFHDPRFRVQLHASGESSTYGWTDTYDITGADVLQVIDWARKQAGDSLSSGAVSSGSSGTTETRALSEDRAWTLLMRDKPMRCGGCWFGGQNRCSFRPRIGCRRARGPYNDGTESR